MKRIIILSLLLFLAFSPAHAAGSVYYVSPVGSDSNPGTMSLPFGSMAKAVSALQAGDTLYMRGGEYLGINNGWVFQNSGTQTQPITIANYPGEQVIFQMTQAARNDYQLFRCVINPHNPPSWATPKADRIRIVGSDVESRILSNGLASNKGIVMQGVEGEQSAAIIASDCDNWEVAGVDFLDVAYGIFTQKNNWLLPEEHSTDGWYVHDNRVHTFYRESGMQFNGNHNRIENNEIYKVTDRVDTPYGCQMLNLLGNNNVVIDNVLDGGGSAAKCAGLLFEWDLADANLVKNNVIRDVRLGVSIQGGDDNVIQGNAITAGGEAWTGIWAASYEGRTSWPCNDYAGSGYSVEAILPPDDPTHPDYLYYYPHDCYSHGNQIIDNRITGFANTFLEWPLSGENVYIETDTLRVMVTWERHLNIRPSPSMYNLAIGNIFYGQIVELLAVERNTEGVWGKLRDDMWIALKLGNRYYTTWRE